MMEIDPDMKFSWMDFLKVEKIGPGTDKFVAEISLIELSTTSSVIVANVFTEENGKQTNIESKLSLNFVNSVDNGSFKFGLGITNNFSINGKQNTYRGKFKALIPESISNNYIASKFVKPLRIIYQGSFCEGHSKCNKPHLFSFAIRKEADRLRAAFRFGLLKVRITTRANPYDSIAPLVNKIFKIDGVHDCDLTGLVFAKNPVNFIRQNKDDQFCIRATFFPDEMLDILDEEYKLNCDTVFSRENIDVTFSSSLSHYGWIYPETAISLCKHSVYEIKGKASRIRNFLLSS